MPPKSTIDWPLNRINKMSNDAKRVFTERFCLKDDNGNLIETVQDAMVRVASFVAAAEVDQARWASTFYNLMSQFRFLPNSPTFTGAGTDLNNLSACFVLPIEDDMGGRRDGIFSTLRNAALIQKTGGGNGFSFSRLRRHGARIRSSKGFASGPVSFMKAYDETFGTINQGGVRRGANMGVLRVDHPDVEAFITAKSGERAITNFNISVALTDEFMARSKEPNGTIDLIDPGTGEVVDTVSARLLFEKIAAAAWTNGEPGVLFIDTANRHNPVPHLGAYEATNPCGEQWLLPYESCNLGCINLSEHIDSIGGYVAWEELASTVRASVRFLDDVVEVNGFVPEVPELAKMAYKTRRIGLGIMGLADMLFKLKIRYGSPEAIELADQLMEFIRFHAMRASVDLAREKGAFEALDGSIYRAPSGEHWRMHEPLLPRTLDFGRPPVNWSWLESDLATFGIRNATTVTIAPTGTRSTVAELEGYGCEPTFALAYRRAVVDNTQAVDATYDISVASKLFRSALIVAGVSARDLQGIMDQVSETGSCQGVPGVPPEVERVFVVAGDLSPEEHVLMAAALQQWIDSSISKTVNLPYEATVADVQRVYELAHSYGLKGITVYRNNSRQVAVLTTGKARDLEFKVDCVNC